jgi:hypothetical protein
MILICDDQENRGASLRGCAVPAGGIHQTSTMRNGRSWSCCCRECAQEAAAARLCTRGGPS